MAKHKKTREEKIAASKKHEEFRVAYSLSDFSKVSVSKKIIPTQTAFSYVTADLQKNIYHCVSASCFTNYSFPVPCTPCNKITGCIILIT